MKQTDLGLNLTTKRTRRRQFLAYMERVVPWAALAELVAPYAPEGKKDRPPFAVETMLRGHFMQQWFTLSDPAMEKALHDVPLFREFASLGSTAACPTKAPFFGSAACHAVRAEQSVDGARQIAGCAGMSASAAQPNSLQGREVAGMNSPSVPADAESVAARRSPNQFFVNARLKSR